MEFKPKDRVIRFSGNTVGDAGTVVSVHPQQVTRGGSTVRIKVKWDSNGHIGMVSDRELTITGDHRARLKNHDWWHPYIIKTIGGTFFVEQRVSEPGQQLYRCYLTGASLDMIQTYGTTPEEAIQLAAATAGHSFAEGF